MHGVRKNASVLPYKAGNTIRPTIEYALRINSGIHYDKMYLATPIEWASVSSSHPPVFLQRGAIGAATVICHCRAD